MKRIHIGHHFFGSGNVGDDFMLAGFMSEIDFSKVELTCCIPYELAPLQSRFPQVKWLPYDFSIRSECIKYSDAWLGLGGSPFQNAVSRWFIDHLLEELTICNSYNIPMYFLGVGAQDEEAFSSPDVATIINNATAFWTRDTTTYKYVKEKKLGISNVYNGADLAHIFFSHCQFPEIKPNSISLTLNFDYQAWPNLRPTIDILDLLKASEFRWVTQEERMLNGAELHLYQQLTKSQQSKWTSYSLAKPGLSLKEIASTWPSSEWSLTSRYHSTLAAAWYGSKTTVLATNLKLQSAAIDCGFNALPLSASPNDILIAIMSANIADRSRLKQKALEASNSVKAFLTCIGLKV